MGNQVFDFRIPLMSKEFISIQDAAKLSKKSAQTIRRAIKAKKIKFRKSRTPQGFNYLISKSSLIEVYRLKIDVRAEQNTSPKKKTVSKSKPLTIEGDDFKSFVASMEAMMANHNEERENFLRLINTMQEKIFVLENQLNLLKSPQKKWYQIWK